MVALHTQQKFVPAAWGEGEAGEKRRLERVINRSLVGDIFTVNDRQLNEPIRVEHVSFYKYGEHYRVFHLDRLLIIHIAGQTETAARVLIGYLQATGIRIETLKVQQDSALCSYELGCKYPPIILLDKKRMTGRAAALKESRA